MPIAYIRPLGESGLYHIHVVDQNVDPGYGQGRPGGDHISNRPPGSGNYPSQGLPGHEGGTDPGYGQGRPSPPHVGGRPPGSGGGGIPDNELPDQPPPQLAPGYTLVLIRHEGKWAYAAIAPGSPPPRPLPPGSIEHPGNRPPGSGAPPRPDAGLPGSQPGVDNTLPGGPPPMVGGGPAPPQPGIGGGPAPTPPPRPGQPLPPTAAPKK